MPRVEAKLTEMNTEIQKTLQLILQNMSLGNQKSEVVTPSVGSSMCNASSLGNKPPVIHIADQTVLPQQPITRNLHKDFCSQEQIPVPTAPGLTMGLPSASLFTESTKIHTDKQQEVHIPQQFRLTSENTAIAVQAHTLGFTGNSGYFAPVTAPLYHLVPTYNQITGQYINTSSTSSALPPVYQATANLYDAQRNQHATQLGGPSYFAEAVLKGPRLEIPLFSGEDPIGWLIACEKFYDMTGTPYDQWVNLAT